MILNNLCYLIIYCSTSFPDLYFQILLYEHDTIFVSENICPPLVLTASLTIPEPVFHTASNSMENILTLAIPPPLAYNMIKKSESWL